MTQEDIIRNCEILQESNSQDPLYRMMFMMMNMLMEMEANKITGSKKGEHNSERTDYRSGTRDRRFDTRLGTFNLKIPKFRNSGYVPFFMQSKQRSEEALISMVVEAYTNGVSTRKIKHLAESLGIENISAGEVSEMNKSLDEMVRAFREEKLESELPVIWVDAVYEKIRVGKHVKSLAVGIFPSMESYLRLMTASLIEYSEDHLTGASYISAETLREQKIQWEKEQKAA